MAHRDRAARKDGLAVSRAVATGPLRIFKAGSKLQTLIVGFEQPLHVEAIAQM